MSGLAWTAVVLLLLFLASLAGLVFVVPSWLEERHRRKCSEEAAERLRQRVREVRAETDAAKDALSRCEAAAIAAAGAARKAGDDVDVANEAIRKALGAPRN